MNDEGRGNRDDDDLEFLMLLHSEYEQSKKQEESKKNETNSYSSYQSYSYDDEEAPEDKKYSIIFDIVMILATSGLWIIWMIIRYFKNKEDNYNKK